MSKYEGEPYPCHCERSEAISLWTPATCFRRHKLRRSDIIVSFPRKRESIYLSTSYSLPPEEVSKAFCV